MHQSTVVFPISCSWILGDRFAIFPGAGMCVAHAHQLTVEGINHIRDSVTSEPTHYYFGLQFSSEMFVIFRLLKSLLVLVCELVFFTHNLRCWTISERMSWRFSQFSAVSSPVKLFIMLAPKGGEIHIPPRAKFTSRFTLGWRAGTICTAEEP